MDGPFIILGSPDFYPGYAPENQAGIHAYRGTQKTQMLCRAGNGGRNQTCGEKCLVLEPVGSTKPLVDPHLRAYT